MIDNYHNKQMSTLSDALHDYIHEVKSYKDTNIVNWGHGNFLLNTYDVKEGSIRLGTLKGTLLIHYAKINIELRKRGRFTKFISYAMTLFERISVAGVGSPFVMLTLNKLQFIDHGGDFMWSKNGICECSSGKDCTNKAYPPDQYKERLKAWLSD